MSLAEDECVLTRARWILNVEIQESAIEQRDQRDGGGKRSTGVQTLVGGIAALPDGQNPDIGILDLQQFHQSLPPQVLRGSCNIELAAHNGRLLNHVSAPAC